MNLTKEQDKEIRRIKQKRKREAVFMAILDFFSVVATLVCVYSDALSLFGMALVLGGPLLGLGLSVGVLCVSVIAGAFWARKKFKGYREDREKELTLMQECFNLENENKKAGITPGYFNKPSEPLSLGEKTLKFLSKVGNRLMSFATGGFSTMLGMAGVLFGALSIAFTPAMPVAILAMFVGVAVFAIAFGVASVVAEFYLSRSQGDHIEELRENKEDALNKKISNLTTQNSLLNSMLTFENKTQNREKHKQHPEKTSSDTPTETSVQETKKEDREGVISIRIENNASPGFFQKVKAESGQEKSELRKRTRSNSLQY